MYSAHGLKWDNLRLDNAHTFVSIIVSLYHNGVISTRTLTLTDILTLIDIRANITFMTRFIVTLSCYLEQLHITV